MTVKITSASPKDVILTVEEGFAGLGNVFPTVRITTPSLVAVTSTVTFRGCSA